MAAARAAGVARVSRRASPSCTSPAPPGTVHGEDDPLTSDPPAQFTRSAQARRRARAHGARRRRRGAALRLLLRPGDVDLADGSIGEEVAKRRLPIVGRATGVWSFIHVDDAARPPWRRSTRGASARLQRRRRRAGAGRASGCPRSRGRSAQPPRRVPACLARPLAGEYGVCTMTRAQGACNARAKQELGWAPEHAELARGLSRRAGLSGVARRDAAPTCARRARPRRPAARARAMRCSADGLPRDAEQAEAVDHDRDRQLTADHDRGQPARAERAHGHQRDAHVDGAEQPADERPPGHPPDLAEPAEAAARDQQISTSAAVPTRNETVAACGRRPSCPAAS